MNKEKSVALTHANGINDEYIIKDLFGITIGRIYIIELDKKNKYCIFRLKLYKDSDKSYEYLIDTMEIMLKTLFRNMNLSKINVLVDEEMSIAPFTDLGFELEGFLHNNITTNGKKKSELLFGIDSLTYEKNFFAKKVVLKGKKIILKILTPEHSKAMLDYCIRNKEHLKPFEPRRDDEYYTLEYQRKSLIDGYKQFLNGKSASFGIFKDEQLIGKVRISNIIMGVFKNANIGYSIDENQQGNGYMKEAVNLVVKYAFEEMELHRIEASALVDNIKSQRVLKACGFKELGINEKYLFINGEWRDHVTYYRINEK